ncbi:MAG: hypothetical protein OEV26_03300 [Gallionella sp.]|nr:hypothetical protein [Gallionella sp.]
MNSIISVGLLLLISSAHAETNVAKQFEDIYAKYESNSALHSEEKVKLLINLDQNIRALIDKQWSQQHQLVDTKLWKKEYEKIGIIIGGFTDTVIYTGKLLKEAKTLDVNSTYDAYTSYTDFCSNCNSFGYMPNIEGALTYAKKYPEGPFIEDTLITIGNFYDDLYKVLKFTNKERVDYKFDCFSKYINKKSLSVQIENARQSAIKYYTNVLALHSDNSSSNETIKEWLTNLKSHNSEGWHYCSD